METVWFVVVEKIKRRYGLLGRPRIKLTYVGGKKGQATATGQANKSTNQISSNALDTFSFQVFNFSE